MEIFHEVLDEFLNSLQYFGVFSKVNILYLHEAKVYRDKELSFNVKNISHTFTRNSLTLIVSSCLSNAWKNNQMLQLIQTFSRYSFCSIVQMLPSHLWLSTVLGKGVETSFTLEGEKLHNTALNSSYLSHSSLSTWSKFCLRSKQMKIMGFAFEDIETKEFQLLDISSEKRLAFFLENSTDEAKRLASYLANLPVSYDVARMIQEEKFETTNLTHIAEVFLGGIIERKETVDKVRFVFRAVPRDYFKVFVSPYEAYDLLEMFMRKKGQSSLSLSAFFANEKGVENLPIDEETLALVRLGIDIKKRMGGTNHDEAVEKEVLLESKILSNDGNEDESSALLPKEVIHKVILN